MKRSFGGFEIAGVEIAEESTESSSHMIVPIFHGRSSRQVTMIVPVVLVVCDRPGSSQCCYITVPVVRALFKTNWTTGTIGTII